MEATYVERAKHDVKKPSAPKWAANPKMIPRWPPAKEELKSITVGEWLLKHLAPGVELSIDDYNLRFRVIGENISWERVPWTNRGWQQTAAEALWWGWRFHLDCRGAPPPYSLDELLV